MKYSVAVVTASALLASASPVAKRALETAWVEKVVTVTVTASDAAPTTAPAPPVFLEKPQATKAAPPPAPPAANQAKEKKPSSKVVYVEPPKSSSAPAKAPVQQPGPQQPKPSKPSKPSKPAQPPSNGDYKSTALYHHNIHRSNHTAPDLEWDETLAQYAQNSAQSCQMVHDMSQGGGNFAYGQNIAVSGGQGGDHVDSVARAATNQWYGGEMNNWHYWGMPNAPSNVGLNEYAHFTQLVWKGSKKVGCYTKSCPSIGAIGGMGGDITFCNYSPPGNYGGRYGDNVLKPQGESMLVV